MRAADPPADLARRVARRAAEAREARSQYAYRQTVTVDELSPQGARAGQYREVREIIFSPGNGRSERLAGDPTDTLKRLRLTEEDFRDLREVQPFLFDTEQLRAYETRYKGEETVEGVPCFTLQVRPRQILAGQRLFDGLIWASQADFSIVRTEGKAVPEHRSTKSENLFPRFTTWWEPVEGGHRFPVLTAGEDTLDFRTGPQRIRLTVRYSEYKRFGAASTVHYGEEVPPRQ